MAFKQPSHLGYIFLGFALWLLGDWIQTNLLNQFGHFWILSSVLMLVFLGVVWVLDGKKLIQGIKPVA